MCFEVLGFEVPGFKVLEVVFTFEPSEEVFGFEVPEDVFTEEVSGFEVPDLEVLGFDEPAVFFLESSLEEKSAFMLLFEDLGNLFDGGGVATKLFFPDVEVLAIGSAVAGVVRSIKIGLSVGLS